MNYRPSFCIVNTVSKQLFRQVRILYLSKHCRKQIQISREGVSQRIHVRREVHILYLLRTTEINLTFQQDVSVNSFRFDVSTQSTATLCPPNQKPTFSRENQKNHVLRHYAARHQKDGFFCFPKEKNGFGQENQLFPRKKMVLDRKTNFFLGKRWFGREKPTFS